MSYLSQLSKPVPQAPVLTIVGFAGSGKSTLAGTFPQPVFVQCENASTVFEHWTQEAQPGLLPIVPAANVKKGIKPSEIILAQLRELATAEHPFKTVVIDSITAMNGLLEAEIVAFDSNANCTSIGDAAGGYNKGYLVLAGLHSQIRNACEHLRRKGMTIVFLAHTGVVKMKNRPDGQEYVAYSLDMHEKSRAIYVSSSDVVAYVKARELITGHEENKKGQTTKFGKVTNTGERVLITSSDGTIGYIDAKTRYDMDSEIDLPKGENPFLTAIPFFSK